MNQMIDAGQPATATPQQELAAILESRRPDSVLAISLNPIPMLETWCRENDAELLEICERDPLPALSQAGRFSLAIVADQLEYMDHHAGEELLGLLRNLHTESLVVLYQPQVAPQKLRWKVADFFGMGLRRHALFHSEGREMTLYSYELSSYNFVRPWNNPRFWANPENWGKYWW